MAALIQPSINGSLPSPQTSAHLHRTFKCSNVPEETRARRFPLLLIQPRWGMINAAICSESPPSPPSLL